VDSTDRMHPVMVSENAHADEVKEWLDETRTLLRSAEILVEWFAVDGAERDECAAFAAALDLPYKYLALIDEWLRVGDSAPTQVSEWTAQRLEVSRELARVIAPMVERVARYQPGFVQGRQVGEPMMELYGRFIGEFGSCVAIPIWGIYPECAPPGWPPTA